MKKFIIALLTVVVATALTTKLSAQYSIPSFNVPVIADPTTFEETPASNMTIGIEYFKKPNTREERKMTVKITDPGRTAIACASIIVYSLDNTIEYGPYMVYAGNPFEIMLSTDYTWGVRIIEATEDCELSVWYE
jgi:hypothetical protein